MLARIDAMATVAVADLARATAFYEGVLGLERCGTPGAGVATLRSGRASIVVYESPYAGTNAATAITWGVGAKFEAIVAMLKEAGVAFEHYDLPGAQRQGEIHACGEFKGVWFKDPDGNILHLNSG